MFVHESLLSYSKKYAWSKSSVKFQIHLLFAHMCSEQNKTQWLKSSGGTLQMCVLRFYSP